MTNLINHYAYFGTADSTISPDEKLAGMTSLFPRVLTRDELPPPYDAEPKTKTLANIATPLELIVQGQGVVAFQVTPGAQFSIILTPSPGAQLGANETGLKLELTSTSAKFFAVTSTSTEIPSKTPKGAAASFLIPGVEDRSASTTFLIAENLDVGDEATKKGPYIWIKSLKYISVVSGTGTSSIRPDLARVSISPLPITNDLPPVVAESVAVTLQDLAIGTSTSIANLSPECQRLYANVTGPGVELDDESFPDFSDALEYSIRTPGKICYKKLKEKASEFGDDPLMTYLRITLGVDGGNSPGVPFVVEIWPSKHKSPIHDHGQAYAIIKVLHGEINASYYTKLGEKSGVKIEPDFTFHKNQVTWLGPDNYQVHNDSDRVCVTIQCYQYGGTDNAHDEYFDYVNKKTGKNEPFYPNSDSRKLNGSNYLTLYP